MDRKFSQDDLKQILSEQKPEYVSELVTELSKAYHHIDDNKYYNLEKYANLLLSNTSSYHMHKETMAHAAFLVEVALFGAIMSMSQWPPSWVPTISLSSKYVGMIGFLVIWGAIHVFIRWQLRNRRWAALRYGGIIRAIRTWITKLPEDDDYLPYVGEKTKGKHKLCRLADMIITWPQADIISDVELDGEPTGIVKCIKEQEKVGTGAVKAEIILTYGSILILLSVMFRTYLGN